MGIRSEYEYWLGYIYNYYYKYNLFYLNELRSQ